MKEKLEILLEMAEKHARHLDGIADEMDFSDINRWGEAEEIVTVIKELLDETR